MIGPSFADEIIAAGLGGAPFSWDVDGNILGRENLTVQQNVTLDAVIAAHNPNTKSSRQLRNEAMLADTNTQDWLTRITTATPAQIDTFFANNVTTAAAAIAVLKAVVKVLAVKF